MGAMNSTRKLTIDSIALLEMLEPNAAEAQAKACVRERIQSILVKEWPTSRVLAFGSSESGLGFGGSDLDLGLYFEDVDLEYLNHFTVSEHLQILSTVCTRLGGEFEITEFVQHARVPVVKLWDPRTQISCDVCIGSVHVLLNTALLKHCARSDPRVRPLAFAVKYWAKQRGINDSANGTLSSYGFMLLLIFFLQSSQAQSLLPSVGSALQSIQSERTLSAVLGRLDSLSVAAQGSTFGSTEQASVGALLCGFFRFYGCEFNVEGDVVSVGTGHALPKAAKWSRAAPWRISIEDPFELAHDVGRVVFSRVGQELLHNEFRRAFDMASTGHRLEAICALDETSWNFHATCYVCSSTTHTPRECTQAIVRADGSTVAVGGRPNAVVGSVGVCWYCGGTGHVKAMCPLYAYAAIPKPVYGSTTQLEVTVVPTVALSSPIPIRAKVSQAKAGWPAAVLEHSPARSNTKKKKRPRRGSISSMASSPEQDHKRKYMLAAHPVARKCGNVPRRHHRAPAVPTVPCIT